MPHKDPAARLAYQREWRAKNADKRRTYDEAWRAKDPERAKEVDREKRKRWRKANPDKDRAINKRWRSKNRERLREYERAWRLANPERVREADLRSRRKGAARARVRARAFVLRKIYGITTVDVEAQFARQNGRCAICGDALKRGVGGMAIDHDHAKPGTARGILCGCCNRGIGALHDDPAILERAVTYLRSDGVWGDRSS